MICLNVSLHVTLSESFRNKFATASHELSAFHVQLLFYFISYYVSIICFRLAGSLDILTVNGYGCKLLNNSYLPLSIIRNIVLGIVFMTLILDIHVYIYASFTIMITLGYNKYK